MSSLEKLLKGKKPSDNPLQPQEGEVYRTREGKTAGPLKKTGNAVWPFYDPATMHAYSRLGRNSEKMETPRDLMERVVQ